jgi:aspartate aminotransferase
VSAVLGKKHSGGQIATSDDLALYLLSEAHVAVVAGTPFGAPDCIRLSYAASEEALVEAAARIERAVAALK